MSALAIGLLAFLSAGLPGAEPVTTQGSRPTPARLQLRNGDVAQGWLDNAPEKAGLAWRVESFVSPFVFPLETLQAVFWPERNAVTPTGEYRCELAGGDVLYGTLLEVRDGELLLDVPPLGPLHLDLREVRRLSPWDRPGNLLFRGPGQLAEWRQTGTEWREEGGRLSCAGLRSQLQRDFAAPPRGRLEFVLSWRQRWDCDFSIGTTADDPATFRFEIWRDDPTPASPFDERPANRERLFGGRAFAPNPPAPPISLDPLQLMLARTVDTTADATRIQSLATYRLDPWQPDAVAGRLHLLAYFDFAAGRLLVQSSAGEPLAELRLPTNPPTGPPTDTVGLLFDKRSGDVQIERLELARWNGEEPRPAATGESRFLRSDGSVVPGTLIGFDSQTRTFRLQTAAGETTLAADELVDLCDDEPRFTDPGRWRAETVSGLSLCGDLVAVEADVVRLQRSGIREPLNVPVAMLRALLPREPLTVPVPPLTALESAQPIGRLQVPGGSLRGQLVDNRPEDGAGLVWKPLGSTTASRLRAEAPTVIDYPEPVTPYPRTHPVPWVLSVPRPSPTAAAGSQSVPLEPPSTLHLRSGDTLDCRQVEISDEGVSFESPHHDLTRLPHELVSALDLRPGTTIGPAAQAKFERSLTLPRSQQTHPPTHLVHGMDGDCLRCRLLGLNSAELQVEVHGRTRAIPRQTVTRIQWLHPEGAEAPVEPVRATPGTTRVLAVLDNRLRVALAVDQVVGDLLLGHHDRLGTCRIDLARTRRLVTHPTGPINAEEPEFAGWQLRPALAPRPRVVASETKPALRVGQAAPEVTLELVGGEPLRLADRKGDILVLEFWASWCEPCLRVLPQAEGVVGEFPEGTVRLIAVNLEESAEVATQVLERLRVKTRIALDKTGTIAAQFGATELPQTVVIDRQGRVAKVLVGGGVEFRTELREVLRAISVGDAEGKK